MFFTFKSTTKTKAIAGPQPGGKQPERRKPVEQEKERKWSQCECCSAGRKQSFLFGFRILCLSVGKGAGRNWKSCESTKMRECNFFFSKTGRRNRPLRQRMREPWRCWSKTTRPRKPWWLPSMMRRRRRPGKRLRPKETPHPPAGPIFRCARWVIYLSLTS